MALMAVASTLLTLGFPHDISLVPMCSNVSFPVLYQGLMIFWRWFPGLAMHFLGWRWVEMVPSCSGGQTYSRRRYKSVSKLVFGTFQIHLALYRADVFPWNQRSLAVSKLGTCKPTQNWFMFRPAMLKTHPNLSHMFFSVGWIF